MTFYKNILLNSIFKIVLFFLFSIVFYIDNSYSEVIHGNPTNYRELLSKLSAGDTLLLKTGIYRNGFPIHSLSGNPGHPIVIKGQRENKKISVFLGRSGHNTISIVNSCHIKIENLVINGMGLEVDAIKAENYSKWAHHIVLEDLLILGHDANQQIVGISTKCPAWNWEIRRVIIKNAGTGIYLGNSDGSAPFVNGIIEYNLIFNTLGYNLQIKHQIVRPQISGMPASSTTIIRHNVFSKNHNGAKGDMARPNVLVGHWPLSGVGVNDIYQIYGNLFYENPDEALFQGEGNIALYNNLLVNDYGTAINIQPHNDVPKMVIIFNNTIVAKDVGIRILGASNDYQQIVVANAVFASKPINAVNQEDNFKNSFAAISNYLNNPNGTIDELDLYPRPGRLGATPYNTSLFDKFIDWNLDFNGKRRSAIFRGAYDGEGQNPGWQPKLGIKTLIKNK